MQAYNDELKRLREKLWQARHTVLELMPEPIRDAFSGYYDCKTEGDFHNWWRGALTKVADQAVPRSNGWEDRAYCPLCGRGSSSPYDEGFKLPAGLDMHLYGDGRANQCSVTREIYWLARDHVEPALEKAKEEETKRTEARRLTEPCILLGPGEEPRLMDEGFMYNGARDAEGIAWARSRLATLGFEACERGNAVSFSLRQGDLVIYADPREQKHIEFAVFRDEKRPKRRHSSRHFRLPDAWKNGLNGKFQAALTKAIPPEWL